ncbi:MAG: tetratricopeptide repeat protein [Pseudomonadota bacterium]
MSLINKMLQDLEARNNPQAEAAVKKPVYEDLKPLSRVAAPRAPRRLPVALLAVVALGGAAAYAWSQWGDRLFSGTNAEPVAVKPAPVARKTPPPKPAAAVPAPTPVAIATAVPTEAATPPAAAPAEKLVEAPVKPAPVTPPVVTEPKKPETAPAPKPAPAGSKASTAKQNGYWTVSRGETLYGIAVQTGVDLPQLSRWNSLGREPVIHPGQRLRLTPPARTAVSQAGAVKTGSVPPQKTPAASAGTAPVKDVPAGSAVMDRKLKPFSPNEKAESEYRRAADLLQQGRMGDAEKHLRLALNADAAHTPARELLAGLMLQQGHWREAQQILEQGIDTVPAHSPFAQLLARVHVEHGADQKALAVMEAGRRAGANNPEYMAFLAALYQRAGRHAEAVKTYSEAVTLNPQEGRWWLGMGISLEAVQDRSAAGNAYERAIQSGTLDDKLLQYARQRLAIVKK